MSSFSSYGMVASRSLLGMSKVDETSSEDSTGKLSSSEGSTGELSSFESRMSLFYLGHSKLFLFRSHQL